MSNAPKYNEKRHQYRLAYTYGVAARFGHKQSLQWISEVDEAVDDEILLGIYEGASLLPPRLGENVFEPPATPRHAVAVRAGRGRRGSRGRDRQRQAREPSPEEKEAKFNHDLQLCEVVRQVQGIRANPVVRGNPKVAEAFTAVVAAAAEVFKEGER
jgi:hypothetical protein